MGNSNDAAELPGFLAGGGEMGELIRAHDWGATALGPPLRWPQALRTVVRVLLNTGHPMYIWWGADLLCLYNDAYRRSIGPERHPSSLGLPAREVWGEIWEFIGPQIQQVMAGKGSTWHENHLVPITRNGRREDVYWTYSYSPIGDEEAVGGVGGVLVVCAETTETVLSEQRYKAELERQKRLFERAPSFIAILRGPEHIFEFANDAYRKLVGGRELLNQPVRKAFPEVEGQGFFENLDHVYRTGERIAEDHVSIRFQDPGASEQHQHFIDYIYAPVVDEAGRVTGIFVEGHDVSETHVAQEALRASQDELRRLNETLEHRVSERSAELIQAQEALRQSQKLEAMGQLTGGVAHDFNNLLTPIIGGLDMLTRRGVGGDRERRLIDGALQSAERARTLVQRLLAFARRQPLQSGAVDVPTLIGGMIDLIASTCGPQIKVQVDLEEGLATAEADANQLEMAILNLAVNARDAMPNGGILTISAACEDVEGGHGTGARPGPYIRIAIADTGTGMDDATMARAIEPFFSTKGIGMGTGLGLSMAHGLASQLGGALTVASKPGVGSKITLWLPRSGKPASAISIPGATPSTAKRLGTALLVDDEDLVRATTAEMLAELGYEVVEAISAVEALDRLAANSRVSLVVTDHLMPGMTGAELAKKVKARWPDVPVLIVSGYAEMEGIDSDLPRLTKPFRGADLAASLAILGIRPVG